MSVRQSWKIHTGKEFWMLRKKTLILDLLILFQKKIIITPKLLYKGSETLEIQISGLFSYT